MEWCACKQQDRETQEARATARNEKLETALECINYIYYMLKAQKCDRLNVHFTYRVRKSGKLFSLHTLNRLSISAKYAFAYNVGYFYKKGGSRGKSVSYTHLTLPTKRIV